MPDTEERDAKSGSKSVLRHVAVIMDGNGRWAKQRGLNRLSGHRAGTENLRRVIRACVDLGIEYLTVYAFSTENWGRPSDEVDGLMALLEEMIDNELEELHAEGVRIIHLGRVDRLNPSLRRKVEHSVRHTAENKTLNLCIAWNYGGRDEIVYAIQNIIREGVPADQITEETVATHLFTAGIPDPELVIRTSGELRSSNFLVWQSAYSEWVVTPTFWPDFDKAELENCISIYQKRDRRFGKLSSCDAEE
ncbi:MAG TPA: isoprenyl transferase [Bellilinea sp.]|nr:isoprenyl transferase [Bellilinea sp.]